MDTTTVFTNRPESGGAPPQTESRQRRNVTARPTASAPRPRTGADILRELAEKKAQEAATKAASHSPEALAAHEEQVERVCSLFDADAILATKIAELSKQKGRHHKDSAAEQNRTETLEILSNDRSVLQGERMAILEKDPLSHEEGLQRYNRRLEAIQMADSNRTGSATVENIRGRIDAAIKDGFVIVASQDDYEFICDQAKESEPPVTAPVFKFDRKFYMATKPWDPEADVTVSISEMIADLQADNDSEDEKVMVEVRRGGFFVSSQRGPDGKGGQFPSGLDLMKREGGFVRQPSLFLFSGKGRYYAVKVGREFVVLENRDRKLLAVNVTGPRTGRVLCTIPDTKSPRDSGVRVARPSPANIIAEGHTISETDLSGIWWDKLRQALEQELQQEKESLTFGDLRDNRKGTWAVSVYWKTGDAKDAKSPEVPLRFKLVGSGNGTFQAINVNPDILEKVDPKASWLARAVREPQPLEMLDSGKWPAIAGLNKTYERDCKLDNMAEDHGANRVATENVDNLVSIGNGKDGRYAVRAMIKRFMGLADGEKQYRKSAVGYIVERSGTTVAIVDAVPGMSVSYAEKLRGKKYEVTELPWEMRVILGSQYYGVRHQDAPEHLRLTKQQQESESNQAAAE